MVLSSCSSLSAPLPLPPSPFFLLYPFFFSQMTQSPLLSWAPGLLASSLCHCGIQIAMAMIILSDCFLHWGLGDSKPPSSTSSSLQECGQQDLFNHSAPFVQYLLPWLRVSWFCAALCSLKDLLLLGQKPLCYLSQRSHPLRLQEEVS